MWVAMALNAMKVAKRHSAMKTVHKAKSKAMQKNKATANKENITSTCRRLMFRRDGPYHSGGPRG